MLYQHLKGCNMEEDKEKIISGGMLLILLFLFAVWGHLMLYFHGVDSWENLNPDRQTQIANYHTNMFFQRIYHDDLYGRYLAARSMTDYLKPWQERGMNIMCLEVCAGVEKLTDLDYNKSLEHLITASGCRGEYLYMDILFIEVYTLMAYLYREFGNTAKRDHYMKKAREKIEYCRNLKKKSKNNFFGRAEFGYTALRALVLADEGKFQSALKVFEEGRKKYGFHRAYTMKSDFVKAIIHQKMNDYEALQKELELLCMLYEKYSVYYIYHNLLLCYDKKKDYRKSLSFLEGQMKLNVKKKTKIDITEFLLSEMAGIYEKMGEKRKAFLIRKQMKTLPANYYEKWKKRIEWFH